MIQKRYYLNLDDDAFPLRTNYELTQILTAYNGSNEMAIFKNYERDNYEFSWIEDKNINQMNSTSAKKSPAPHNFTVVSGSYYYILNRDFCEYGIRSSETSRDLLKWLEDTKLPEIRLH